MVLASTVHITIAMIAQGFLLYSAYLLKSLHTSCMHTMCVQAAIREYSVWLELCRREHLAQHLLSDESGLSGKLLDWQ